jgi:PhnB protein
MFNNNCEEALAVYEQAFGAKVLHKQTYGDMPPNPDFPVALEEKGLVLNAQFEIAGTVLMASDVGQLAATVGNNMYVAITTEDKALTTNAWELLKEGGEVINDLQPTFFAELHGSLRDKFGISWMFTAGMNNN